MERSHSRRANEVAVRLTPISLGQPLLSPLPTVMKLVFPAITTVIREVILPPF